MKLDKIIKILGIVALFFLLADVRVLAQSDVPNEQAETDETGTIRLPEPPASMDNANTAPVDSLAAGSPDQTKDLSKAEMVYLNVQDQEITDVIRQISKATAKNFIIDSKIRGKVTILSEKMMTKEEAYQAFLSAWK